MWMVLESAAGGVLVCGSVGCAGAAVLRRASRPSGALLTLALAAAAAWELGAPDGLLVAACALATAGALLLVGRPLAMSWLDAGMGASAAAALAGALGAGTATTPPPAGVAATLALARWRVTPATLAAVAGLVALGVDGAPAALAAPWFAGAGGVA